MRIWLDDTRLPPDGWVWCRNSDEFIRVVSGLSEGPEEVAFDHDLGDDSKDGSWCATFLINQIMYRRWKTPEWSIHSANPEGARNIESKFRSWEKVSRG